VSYVFILVTVHKHSSGVSSKALSILSAHITVVVFFLVSALLSMWPFPTLPIDQFLAIFDAIVTPFMNPVIYTFRNKKMKVAVRRIFVKS
jgi:olfactory receptor